MLSATRSIGYTAGLACLLALAWLAAGVLSAQAKTPVLGQPLLALAAGPAQEDPLQLGARLYAENCVMCHGPEGQGRVGATLAKDWPSIRPDLTVRTIIANGVAGSPMPAWSQANGGPFSEAEIDALVQYILSWQTGGAPQITPRPTATLGNPITPAPNVEGDPNHGKQMFSENCAVCHGENGQGRQGATLAKSWAGIRPDLSVKTTISNGVPGTTMPAWHQDQGGPLSEADINDLTAYVLSLEAQEMVELVQTTPGVVPNTAPTASGSPLRGWAGILLLVVLTVGILAAAIWLQRRRP